MTLPVSQFMVKQWKAFVEDMKGIRQAKKSAPPQKTAEKKKRSRIQEEDEDDQILVKRSADALTIVSRLFQALLTEMTFSPRSFKRAGGKRDSASSRICAKYAVSIRFS
ncbi:hypothetical protein ABFY43_20825 [Bacillus pumilus]